jgi:hypothetical protein
LFRVSRPQGGEPNAASIAVNSCFFLSAATLRSWNDGVKAIPAAAHHNFRNISQFVLMDIGDELS